MGGTKNNRINIDTRSVMAKMFAPLLGNIVACKGISGAEALHDPAQVSQMAKDFTKSLIREVGKEAHVKLRLTDNETTKIEKEVSRMIKRIDKAIDMEISKYKGLSPDDVLNDAQKMKAIQNSIATTESHANVRKEFRSLIEEIIDFFKSLFTKTTVTIDSVAKKIIKKSEVQDIEESQRKSVEKVR